MFCNVRPLTSVWHSSGLFLDTASRALWLYRVSVQRFQDLRYDDLPVICFLCLVSAANFSVPSAIGISLQIALPASNIAGRTIGVILMPSFVGTLAVMMGLPAQNTGGYTKRSVSVGMAFCGYCIGNILGPLGKTFYDFFKCDVLICSICRWSDTLLHLRLHHLLGLFRLPVDPVRWPQNLLGSAEQETSGAHSGERSCRHF